MKVNEYLVKLSTSPIITSQGLEIDEEVALYVKGTVTKKEYKTNNDGTVDEIAVVKGELCEK